MLEGDVEPLHILRYIRHMKNSCHDFIINKIATLTSLEGYIVSIKWLIDNDVFHKLEKSRAMLLKHKITHSLCENCLIDIEGSRDILQTAISIKKVNYVSL